MEGLARSVYSASPEQLQAMESTIMEKLDPLVQNAEKRVNNKTYFNAIPDIAVQALAKCLQHGSKQLQKAVLHLFGVWSLDSRLSKVMLTSSTNGTVNQLIRQEDDLDLRIQALNCLVNGAMHATVGVAVVNNKEFELIPLLIDISLNQSDFQTAQETLKNKASFYALQVLTNLAGAHEQDITNALLHHEILNVIVRLLPVRYDKLQMSTAILLQNLASDLTAAVALVQSMALYKLMDCLEEPLTPSCVKQSLIESLHSLAGAKVENPDKHGLILMDAGMTQILMPYVLDRDTSVDPLSQAATMALNELGMGVAALDYGARKKAKKTRRKAPKSPKEKKPVVQLTKEQQQEVANSFLPVHLQQKKKKGNANKNKTKKKRNRRKRHR